MFNAGVGAQSWAAYFLSLSFDAMLRELQIVLAHLDVRKEKNIYKLLFSVIRNVQLDL